MLVAFAHNVRSAKEPVIGLVVLVAQRLSIDKRITRRVTKKTSSVQMRLVMVAGMGFEPHDLRVMSPMSYQTALPRDKALACASVF